MKKVKSNFWVNVGNNIRKLRKTNNMTIRELADTIDICPEPLGNIERGCNAPSSRVLWGLAKELNVSTDILFSQSDDEFQINFENQQTSPFPIHTQTRKISEKIESTAKDICEDYILLEKECGASKKASLPLRIMLEPNEEGMFELAEKVRDFMNIKSNIIFDYFELFENCGFRIIVMQLPENLNSFSCFDPQNENVFFFINSSKNYEMQLFSLVCELGLLYLRFTPANVRKTCTEMQLLAAKFAEAFLIPEKTLHQTVTQLGIESDSWTFELLLRIKQRYGVSADIFLYHLKRFSLIDNQTFNSLNNIIDNYNKEPTIEPNNNVIRIPNARLWNLFLIATQKSKNKKLLNTIEKNLKKAKVNHRPTVTSSPESRLSEHNFLN